MSFCVEGTEGWSSELRTDPPNGTTGKCVCVYIYIIYVCMYECMCIYIYNIMLSIFFDDMHIPELTSFYQDL